MGGITIRQRQVVFERLRIFLFSLPIRSTSHSHSHPVFAESLIFFIETMISSNVGAAPKIIGIVFA